MAYIIIIDHINNVCIPSTATVLHKQYKFLHLLRQYTNYNVSNVFAFFRDTFFNFFSTHTVEIWKGLDAYRLKFNFLKNIF